MVAGALEQLGVVGQQREAERAEAGLADADQLPLPAQLEVDLGQLEAVACARRAPAAACDSLLPNSRHSDACSPRPTRPRSWCSWLMPKRSASSTSITVAFGTSMPTSITVVATSTSAPPAAKREHRLLLLARRHAAVQQDEPAVREDVALEPLVLLGRRARLAAPRTASTSGQTTNAWRPGVELLLDARVGAGALGLRCWRRGW